MADKEPIPFRRPEMPEGADEKNKGAAESGGRNGKIVNFEGLREKQKQADRLKELRALDFIRLHI